jgi:hypothetical protein
MSPSLGAFASIPTVSAAEELFRGGIMHVEKNQKK